jgi:hypothetical protein
VARGPCSNSLKTKSAGPKQNPKLGLKLANIGPTTAQNCPNNCPTLNQQLTKTGGLLHRARVPNLELLSILLISMRFGLEQTLRILETNHQEYDRVEPSLSMA